MTKRKTPVRPPVKTHKRNGKTITSFMRGYGIAKKRSSKVVKKSSVFLNGPENPFLVDIDEEIPTGVRYSKTLEKEMVEAFRVGEEHNLPGYAEFIEERLAVDEFTRKNGKLELTAKGRATFIKELQYEPKLEFKKIRQGAKDTIKRLKAKAKAGVKAGAKAGAKGARSLVDTAAYKSREKMAAAILKPCYQKDRAKRIAARHALKMTFPGLYSMCDFSGEGGRRRKPLKVEAVPTRFRDLE